MLGHTQNVIIKCCFACKNQVKKFLAPIGHWMPALLRHLLLIKLRRRHVWIFTMQISVFNENIIVKIVMFKRIPLFKRSKRFQIMPLTTFISILA